MEHIFTYTLVHATIRCCIPIMYAAMACVVTKQANVFNIGVEGMMLLAAFFSVYVSYLTGSWILAVLVAILVGVLGGALLAVTHLKYKANIAVVGICFNLLATAATTFLMQVMLSAFAQFIDPNIVPIPTISFAAFEGNAVLKSLFSDYSLFELLAPVVVVLLWFILYKTVWGLRLRSVGFNEMAAQTAGINPTVKKVQALLVSGALAGIAGVHLALGYVTMFTASIVNGRGYMGFAAMSFGQANPLYTAIGCLVFGFLEAIGARVQLIGIPSQFVLCLPHIVTVIVLVSSNIREFRKEKKRRSAAAYAVIQQ